MHTKQILIIDADLQDPPEVIVDMAGRAVMGFWEVVRQLGFYRRAGLMVIGPFAPGAPRRRWLPGLLPMSCVGVCRAVLGGDAPFALTPFGLFRRLLKILCQNRNFILTTGGG